MITMMAIMNFGRLLTKKDVDLVVENGSPFLFKHALNSLRRMRAFVNSVDCSVSLQSHP